MLKLILTVIFFLPLVQSTVDLEVQHLQFVADHIDRKECKKLVSSLHEKTYRLLKQLNYSSVPDKPCLALLLTWDRTEAYGKTFNDLSLRLTEIGRGDIADKMSKALYKGEVEVLNEYFLKDPYKNSVPTDSFLLEQEEKKRKKKDKQKSKPMSTWQIVLVVLGCITGSVIITWGIYKLFGTAIARTFKKYAPEWLVAWFDMVKSQVRFIYRSTKRKFMKEVVGQDQNRRNLSRNKVMELNRNLNNYLNGHWTDAALYFDQFINN